MTSEWIMDELQDVQLVDKRLENRFRKLHDTLSQASDASIPAACQSHAEMVAAYRFFDNDEVEFESVLAPHVESTHRRVAKQQVVLLVQDTTELDLTRPHSVKLTLRADSTNTSKNRSITPFPQHHKALLIASRLFHHVTRHPAEHDRASHPTGEVEAKPTDDSAATPP